MCCSGDCGREQKDKMGFHSGGVFGWRLGIVMVVVSSQLESVALHLLICSCLACVVVCSSIRQQGKNIFPLYFDSSSWTALRIRMIVFRTMRAVTERDRVRKQHETRGHAEQSSSPMGQQQQQRRRGEQQRMRGAGEGQERSMHVLSHCGERRVSVYLFRTSEQDIRKGIA